MAVNCAILSYNGQVYFGFSGDVHAAPDLKRMENLLESSFDELRKAVGLRPPQKTSVFKKRRAVPAAATRQKTVPSEASASSSSSPVEEKRKPDSAHPANAERPLAQFVVA
jgi:hypothetical protein